MKLNTQWRVVETKTAGAEVALFTGPYTGCMERIRNPRAAGADVQILPLRDPQTTVSDSGCQ